MPMPKTRRRNAKPKANNAEALVARLPDDLRSFDAPGHYPDGLRAYLATLEAFTAESPVSTVAVMNAAGLSAADWFRHMLTHPTKD
jgi:hypothetical protein